MAGHIFIYGAIGTERGEVSGDNVRAQLNDPEVKNEKELILHLISPGGSVDTGQEIYNLLKNSGKTITTHIEGTCASIATLIAGVGETTIMNKGARFMIHNPQITGLNQPSDARALRHVANQLDQIKTLLINVYDKKTSLGKEKLWELYDNETWLTAEDAERMGFVDQAVDAIKAVAKIDLTKFKMEKKQEWSLVAAFKNLLGLSKIKNQMQETLADGRSIVVMSDDENWTGKQVVTVEGEPLAPGEHQLVSGKILVVGDGSTITEVKEAPEAKAEEKPTENTEMENKEIESLKAKIAELEGQKAAAEAKVLETETKSSAATAKFENRVNELEKKYLKLAEEAGKTVGDTTKPPLGPVIKNVGGDDIVHDPMTAFFIRTQKARSGN